ncbi:MULTISPECIES: hypothetical protein [unclassified Cryobacterium]|uniref:hypothetical protein n=1 Tax=unclassified Cryobacterium TaxID=2649013 RepID=UPI002AB47002|nr:MULTISPECIES: hypothetical protein [unclassified Cryobacterium]MDY7528884.1 hypothetical protein [Cryobacterium sp. 10C2]MDY7555375.1 hypothetical protein [Cryobacterium sp. 10C3]MEB0200695.1 hypothetical protein [Cryobacterium sp. 5I3]MEB0288595.1 hypothetical protein [Cryobacterium sp. 10S3]MEB0292381.1 hypothetical protein [Cryobacterium sp. 10C2]
MKEITISAASFVAAELVLTVHLGSTRSGQREAGSSEIRQRTIEGRIRHLEKEIATFSRQIRQLLGEEWQSRPS